MKATKSKLSAPLSPQHLPRCWNGRMACCNYSKRWQPCLKIRTLASQECLLRKGRFCLCWWAEIVNRLGVTQRFWVFRSDSLRAIWEATQWIRYVRLLWKLNQRRRLFDIFLEDRFCTPHQSLLNLQWRMFSDFDSGLWLDLHFAYFLVFQQFHQ